MSVKHDSRLKVVVMGYLVRGPVGGMAWHYLQYVMGLAELGHEVYYVEDSGDSDGCCYDPSRDAMGNDPAYGLRYTANAFDRLGLQPRWAYFDAHAQMWHGPCADRIQSVENADMLLNVSGVNTLRPWSESITKRVLVDTDPVFTQIRNLTDASRAKEASMHSAFFSFGANIGASDCDVPDDGLPWRPTRQPIVLRAWPVTRGPVDGRFTTVMQWDSYPPLQFGGKAYGMKSDSFQPYWDLPAQSHAQFDLAVGSPSAPKDAFLKNGWGISNPLTVAGDPWSYQQFIRASRAEFGIAKHGYAVARSGWFSERSAAYLASGRPVLVQETGFSDWMETGSGVIPFSSPEEAVAGIREINARYDIHCQTARQVAETYFDAGHVLATLIEDTFASDPAPSAQSRVD